jgi:hypothetical protein
MDAAYRLTYDDSAAPSHYGWKQPSRLRAIDAAYHAAQRALKEGKTPAEEKAAAAGGETPASQESLASLESRVKKILGGLDDQGRWVSTYAGERLVGQPKFAGGFRYLSSATFSRNVETLSAYLAASKKAK